MRVARPLIISGAPGVGKSTVGPRVAALLGWPFVDLDRAIEQSERQSISEIFANRGAAAFRTLEAVHLRALIKRETPHVVAVGGGTLVEQSLRTDALDDARVVTLNASLQTLVSRVGTGEGRPLLEGRDVRDTLHALLAVRVHAYAEAHLIVDTDDLAPEQVADEIVKQIDDVQVLVRLGARSYRAHIGHNANALAMRYAKVFAQRLWVRDAHWVAAHSECELLASSASLAHIDLDVKHKTLTCVERVWTAAHEAALGRDGLFIACGGGSIGDVAGFAAATWKRGTQWINVPTTALAMVDSCLGGKTGVDFSSTKNVIGAVHQPSAAFVDPRWLSTLSPQGRAHGLVEALKCAMLAGDAAMKSFERDVDAALVGDVDAWLRIIAQSLDTKARYVACDEHDVGVRHALNFGHTIGHAIELTAGVPHGVAVAHGMLAELALGGAGQAKALADWAKQMLERVNVLDPIAVSADAFRHALGQDKKRKTSEITMLLPDGDGGQRDMQADVEQLVRAFFAYVNPGR